MTSTNNVLEYEPDNSPRNVVDRSCGGDETSSGKDNGEVDVLNNGVRILEGNRPSSKWSNSADKEEENEAIIDLTFRELECGPNDTPDDRGSAEHLSRWADETVRLVKIAHAVDVGEHPSLDAELDGSSDDGRDNLAEEHGARTV